MCEEGADPNRGGFRTDARANPPEWPMKKKHTTHNTPKTLHQRHQTRVPHTPPPPPPPPPRTHTRQNSYYVNYRRKGCVGDDRQPRECINSTAGPCPCTHTHEHTYRRTHIQ